MFRTTSNFRSRQAHGDATDFGANSICPIDAIKLFRLSRKIFENLGDKVRADSILYEKASLSDLYVKGDYEVTYEAISRFQKLASKYGYRYNWKGEHVCVTWGVAQELVSQQNINDFDCQRKSDLAVMLHARDKVSCEFRHFMRNWPYKGHEHIAHYGSDGVRLKGSPETLPYYAWEFVRTGKERDYKKLSPNMAVDLVHLFRVAFSGHEPDYDITEKDALLYLRTERIKRLRMKDRGAYSKTYMSVVPGKANNFNKFYAPQVTGVVHHYGSGSIEKLSRYSFPNANKVIGIDPLANGPHDHCGLHSTYDGVKEGEWIVSDASLYEVLVSHYDKPYVTGLDCNSTNDINNDIYKIALEKKCPVILKLGIQPENEIPYPLNEGLFVVHSKIRLHNAEVIVREDKEGEPLMKIFRRMAYVCKRANELRVRMDAEHIYPCPEFKEEIMDLRPTVMEMAEEVMVYVAWDEPGTLPKGPMNVRKRLPGKILDKFLWEIQGQNFFDISDGELTGMDFIGAYRYIVDIKKINFKDSSEIVAVLCEYAKNNGVGGDVQLLNIKF